MRVSTEELEYWGEQFRELELSRYMRFATFLHAPRQHLKRIFGGECRPLLARQLKMKSLMWLPTGAEILARLERVGGQPYQPERDLMATLDELESIIGARMGEHPERWMEGAA